MEKDKNQVLFVICAQSTALCRVELADLCWLTEHCRSLWAAWQRKSGMPAASQAYSTAPALQDKHSWLQHACKGVSFFVSMPKWQRVVFLIRGGTLWGVLAALAVLNNDCWIQ